MNCPDADSFVFNEIDCRTLGLMICYFSSSSKTDERDTGLAVDVKTDDFNIVRKEYNQYGVIYKEPISFEFGIAKIDQTPFTKMESHSINKWLSTDTYKILRFNDKNPENIIYHAICTSIKDVYIGDHYGKTLRFETNSPYGFSRNIKRTINGTFDGVSEIVKNDSDDGVYYPLIELNVMDGYSNTIVIENTTDNKSLTIDFANLSDYSLLINTKRTRITNTDGKLIPAYQMGWDENYSSIVSNPDIGETNEIYFPRLLFGDNEIRITGECTATFNLEFPRKVGSML